MATVQQGNSPVTANSTVNNGGTAVNVGTSSVLDSRSLGRDDLGVFGSTPVESATEDYADKALGAGTFKSENQRGVIQRVTKTLAGGVSNDFLTHAADDLVNARSIHRQEVVTTTRTSTAIRAGDWNIYSGSWTNDPTTATDPFWDIDANTTSNTSTDEAASPSRNVPGELTYKLAQKLPVSVDYKAKTG